MRGGYCVPGRCHIYMVCAALLCVFALAYGAHTDKPFSNSVHSNGSHVVLEATTTSTQGPRTNSGSDTLSTPAIAGIVGGVGFLILIIVLAVKYCDERRGNKRAMSATALTDALIQQFASVRVGGGAYVPSDGGSGGDNEAADAEVESVGSWDGRDTVISVKDGVYSNIFGKRQTVNPPSDAAGSSVVTAARTEDPNLHRDLAVPPLPPRPNTAPEEKLPARPQIRHPPAYARADPDVPESVLEELDPEVQQILRTGRPPETGFHLEAA